MRKESDRDRTESDYMKLTDAYTMSTLPGKNGRQNLTANIILAANYV